MLELRKRAVEAFNVDFSEKRICGENNLAVDFFFEDEATIVEIALGLHNPLSELERDIFKAIIANDNGYTVRTLLFVSKPGAKARCEQPAAQAIRAWVQTNCDVEIEIYELTNKRE